MLLFILSCRVQPAPIPLNFIAEAIVIPLKVIVFPVDVAAKVIAPVYVLVIVDTIVKLPYTFSANDPAKVKAPTSGLPSVMSEQFAIAVTVTVYAVAFDNESNVTVSAEVGTEKPPAPPDVSDQFVVVEASQFPVPPTQNRAAIDYTLAIHLHLDVPALYWNNVVTGSVVDPFDVTGAVTVLFSVFTQVIV